jgi:Na+/H+ antiporter NhaD/arsenite permease-like protein
MELKWIVLALAAAMYVLVIIFPQRKAWITAGAALAVLAVAFGFGSETITPLKALTGYINWSVLLIFVGSLIIAELFIYSRVPARIADNIVDVSPNAGVAIVAILMMTGIVSAFVENVATVLVMAPIALALSKKLKMPPTYFLVGLAVMANLQGTATLVGDPPSMIFASYARYGFNDFFVYSGRPSIFFVVQVGMLAGALFFYAYFARHGSKKITVEREPILSWFPTILLLLMILALALGSFFHTGISLGPSAAVLGLGIAGLLWYRFIRKESRDDTVKMIKGLDWETVIFLVGIFVVVGAISDTGLLGEFAAFLGSVIGNNVLLGFVVILLVSVLISGFVDNVPYIIVMLPVAGTLATAMGLEKELYMFALLIGSCLGGNLTPIGASANVVAVGLLKKQGVEMGFKEWFKIGVPFTLLTTTAASVFLWFVWR